MLIGPGMCLHAARKKEKVVGPRSVLETALSEAGVFNDKIFHRALGVCETNMNARTAGAKDDG